MTPDELFSTPSNQGEQNLVKPDQLFGETQNNPEPPSTSEAIGSGLEQSVHDIVDYPLQLMAKGSEKIGLGGPISRLILSAAMPGNPYIPTSEELKKKNIANTAAYESRYGKIPAAEISRTTGDIGLTTAALLTGEGALSVLGEVATGSLPAEVAARLLSAARFASGKTPGGLLTRGASLATRGALEGSAAAAISSGAEGPTKGTLGAGALVGAALSPAMATGLSLGSLGWRTFSRWLGSMFETPASAAKSAIKKVVESMEKDGIKPADAIAQLRELGPDGMLADLKGTNIRANAEGLANSTGPGSEIARSSIEGRAEAQPERLEQYVKGAVGDSTDFSGAMDDLMTARSRTAKPIYEKAFSQSKLTPDQVAKYQPYLESPQGQKALNEGLEIIQAENLGQGKTFNPNDYGLVKTDEGWRLNPEGGNSLRALDAIKRGLDNIIDSNTETGRMNQMGRAYNMARRSLVQSLRVSFPDYATALDTWGGPSSAMEALKFGRSILKEDASLTAKEVSKMTPNEKSFFLIGVGRSLMDKVESTPEGADATRKIFGNPAIRSKIKAGFDDPQKFEEFEKQMQREAIYAQSRNGLIKGSPTARRLAAQEHITDMIPHAIRAASGDIIGAVKGAGLSSINRSLGPSDAYHTELAKLYFTPGIADELESAIQGIRPGLVNRGLTALGKGTQRVAIPAVVSTGALRQTPRNDENSTP